MRRLPHAPYYTDNLMHNLRVERFYKETMNGQEKKDLVAFMRAL